MKIIQYTCLLLMLAGYQLVQAAEPIFASDAESASARELKPSAGKALIYIYQRNDAGAAVSPRVWLNNYEIGHLAPGSFTVWQLAPGRLEIKIDGAPPVTLILQSEAGKLFLFRVSMKQTENGKKAVLESLPEYDRMDMAGTRLLRNPRELSAPVTASGTPAAPVGTAAATSSTPPPQTTSAHAAKHSREEALTTGGYSLALKVGSMSLAQDSQTVLGVPSTFDKKASGNYAIEFDSLYESGMAVGFEWKTYKTSFTRSGITSDVSVNAYLIDWKQYFNTASHWQPYFGLGLGYATSSISGTTGAISGSTSGFAWQALGGLEYRGQSFGVLAEVSYLGANTSDSSNQKIDLSGTALLAGVVFHF